MRKAHQLRQMIVDWISTNGGPIQPQIAARNMKSYLEGIKSNNKVSNSFSFLVSQIDLVNIQNQIDGMKAMMAKMIKMQESLQSVPAVTCGKLGEKINIYHPTSLLKSAHYRMIGFYLVHDCLMKF